MRCRQGLLALKDWLTQGRSRQPAALHSFARGIRRDQQAVIAGLALPHRSGALEGKNCQTKLASWATTPITGVARRRI
jgi:transposase